MTRQARQQELVPVAVDNTGWVPRLGAQFAECCKPVSDPVPEALLCAQRRHTDARGECHNAHVTQSFVVTLYLRKLWCAVCLRLCQAQRAQRQAASSVSRSRDCTVLSSACAPAAALGRERCLLSSQIHERLEPRQTLHVRGKHICSK